MKKEIMEEETIKKVADYIKKGFIDKNTLYSKTIGHISLSSKIYFVQKQNTNWFYLAVVQNSVDYYEPAPIMIKYFVEKRYIRTIHPNDLDGIFIGNIPDKDKVISELKNIDEDIIIDYDDFEEGNLGTIHFSVIAISYLNSLKNITNTARSLKLSKELIEVRGNIESYRVAVSNKNDNVIAVSKNAINELLTNPKYIDICITLLNNTKEDALGYKAQAVEYENCFKSRMSVVEMLPSELQLYLEINDF